MPVRAVGPVARIAVGFLVYGIDKLWLGTVMEAEMIESQTIRLKVVGENTLHCSGCERTVEFTLSHIPGIDQVVADHNQQTIQFVSTSTDTDLEKVKADLQWIGYEVEVA